MNKRQQLFENPTASYRGKPFWSWNGELKKEELLRQIENFKKMGMGGYFCHSRIGLVTEYLGEEWFSLINACADKGEELGLHCCLYDEDRWPSGTAGGAVTQNPDYRLHYIRMETVDGGDVCWDDSVLACFAVDLDGFAFQNKQRLHKGQNALGRTVLRFSVEEMASNSFYNGFTYVDTMNRAATEEFLRLTHDKYAQNCGGRLGKNIYSIFTDEPHRGSVMNGFSLDNPVAQNLTPYTAELMPRFQEAYGVDLTDYLPELFLWKDGQKLHPVKWQYMELLQQLFIDNFLKPIQQWCGEHHIDLTGHLLHEDCPVAQSCMIGSVQRGYEYMDVPGIDVLGEFNTNYWVAKQIASAARQLGQNRILSEMYACGGWHLDFQSFKNTGDWQALLGVNERCHHLSWYSMKGSGKRDYPPSISGQSAWYKDFSYVEDYFSRIHVFMEEGEPVCDILVVNPVESNWAAIYPDWSRNLSPVDPDLVKIQDIYLHTFWRLCQAKLDFDYGDEDFLKRKGSVEVRDGETLLRVGDMTYRRVLVTGMLTMRSTTLALLREFSDKGGKLVFAGDAPDYIDVLKNEGAKTLKADYVPFERDAMINALDLSPLVEVTDKEGQNIPDIYAQIKRDKDGYRFFLMNMSRETAHKGCTVRLKTGGYCERWDARSGRVELLTKGQPLVFQWDFAQNEELLLAVTAQDRGYPPFQAAGPALDTICCPQQFSYTLSEPNVCTLSFVDYQIDGGLEVSGQDILQADLQIRRQMGLEPRSGESLQPWFVAKTHPQPVCSLTLRYPFMVDTLPRDLRLVVESPEDFQVTINGRDALTKTDDFWVDCAFTVFRVDPAVLKQGRNTVELRCGFRTDINLESVYLLGDFGVTLEGTTAHLGELPRALRPGDISTQGLPFYGAEVAYHMTVPTLKEGQKMLVSTDTLAHAACVRLEGEKGEAMLAFRPLTADITGILGENGRLTIHCVMTRHNTFEPVRPAPQFTGEYELLNQGISDHLKMTIV